MSLKNVADDYFSKLNSIAARLHVDMNETKAAYEDLWGSLNCKEQNQILSESIINPEISLRYNVVSEASTPEQKYALKLIVDDNCSYRDEHSAPFSFRTPSQRDLTIFSGPPKEEIPEKPIAPARKTKVELISR